jgi:hypothetical protein
MGNSSSSSVISDVQSWADSAFGYATNSDTSSQEQQDTTITPNQNITELEDRATSVNTQVQANMTTVNQKLQQINYSDNNIKKMQELLQLEADRGNKQLAKMYRDELEIATKTSIANTINDSITRQKEVISLLVVIFVLIILLVIPLVFMITGRLSKAAFASIVILDFIIIALIIAWKNNVLYIRSFFTTFGSDLEDVATTANTELQTRVQDFNSIVRQDVYGSETEFQAKYCCPNTEEITTEIMNDEVTPTEYLEPGFYYDDGSAPLQLVVSDNNSQEADQQIRWPDYAKSRQRAHSLIKGSEVYDELDDRLVGNTTNTRNM